MVHEFGKSWELFGIVVGGGGVDRVTLVVVEVEETDMTAKNTAITSWA